MPVLCLSFDVIILFFTTWLIKHDTKENAKGVVSTLPELAIVEVTLLFFVQVTYYKHFIQNVLISSQVFAVKVK